VSVTGTENLMMAATLAEGQTVLKNAAKEPEVCDLAMGLIAMGAKISGAGTDTIIIDGIVSLHGADHTIIPDRVEAATYAIGAVITHGDVILDGVRFDDLSVFWESLERAGATIKNIKGPKTKSAAHVSMNKDLSGVDVMTGPYPGFPTDVQAQFMALMTLCKGASMITETIFENRFMHVSELCRMGANITVHNASALVRGTNQLNGAQVMATDLRASVSLVLAGLVANGTTEINRIYHIDRGYEQIEHKLQMCGINIERA
jgi:UDP-N-acetylglucosamine 1-carboxyvinyltransferase